MLSKYDDLLIHQIGYPIDTVATTDPRAFDRFYFNIHDTSGEFMIAFGAGTYPNLEVMDAGVGAIYQGHQWNVRLSRELKGGDRADTVIGPISFEVIEGLKTWRAKLDENPHGVSFDLTFRARSVPIETPHGLIKQGNWTAFDMDHYTQPGRYEGWLKIGDRRWEVTPDRFFGHRDRSWGVRMIGGITRAGREPAKSGIARGLHLWVPVAFQDRCVFIYYQEDQGGVASHCCGGVYYEDGRISAPFVRVEHDIQYDPVSRIHTGSTLTAIQSDGGSVTLESRALLPGVYLSGMGYGTHGYYRGELDVTGEKWNLEVPPADSVQYGVGADQLAEFHSNGDVGYGIYEHSVGRIHPRYGDLPPEA